MTLGILAAFFAYIQDGRHARQLGMRSKEGWKNWLILLGSILILAVSIFVLYQPFGRWYGQGYNSIKLWEGDQSPFWSYITHWGLFLFIILSWLIWETREWMANTPVSALAKLRRYNGLILSMLLVFFLAVVLLLINGVAIAWVAIPLALWAGVLLFRPGQSDMKRIVLFLVGTALVLTLTVELIVLEGDIGRMNTVFKFYLQAWTLLSVSAAAALLWLLPEVLNKWLMAWRTSWQIIFALLLGSAALFPIFASVDKISDRMSDDAPITLDGMAFMKSANYFESGEKLELAQDYNAILWVQDNIEGTPVIVEANTPEYRWASRFSIYTGLPGVVGWNWHQRQQRGVVSTLWVTDRVDDVGHFYRTLDKKFVENFIQKYDVEYIIVGQLEKAYYGTEGLRKFQDWQNEFWVLRYQSQDTSIYEVMQ